MAEIRKHDPSTGNAIQQALRAAMGEGIRPRVPGEDGPPRPVKGTGVTTWVNLQVQQPTPVPEDDETAGP